MNRQGVDVVYDGVGQATFEQSLKFLRARGLHLAMGHFYQGVCGGELYP